MCLGKSSLFDLKIANVTDLSSRSCSSLRELFLPFAFEFFIGQKVICGKVIIGKASLLSIFVSYKTLVF